jgi:methyl-accepting chemotaxis protein
MVAQIYQNLRMITLHPEIRAFQGSNLTQDQTEKFDTKYFGKNLQNSIQQIYNNLATNVAVSEIYGVKRGFSTQGRSMPFFSFDELILNRDEFKKEQENELRLADTPKEDEDEEYKWFESELRDIEAKYPNYNFSRLEDVPLIVSPRIRTCDNSQYKSISRNSPSEADGYVFAVPFYDMSGKFSGIIVAIIRTNAIEALLSDLPSALVSDDDHKSAKAAGINLDLGPQSFILSTHADTIVDRRNKDLIQSMLHNKDDFLTTTLDLPQYPNIKNWTLALRKSPMLSASIQAPLLFLGLVI